MGPSYYFWSGVDAGAALLGFLGVVIGAIVAIGAVLWGVTLLGIWLTDLYVARKKRS